MYGGAKSAVVRVTVLSRDPSVAAALRRGHCDVFAAPSPFEAAAAILAGSSVLVVDLRNLPARHGQLLTLAARESADVFTIGQARPGLAEAMEQIHVTSLKDASELPAALEAIVAAKASRPEAPRADLAPRGKPPVRTAAGKSSRTKATGPRFQHQAAELAQAQIIQERSASVPADEPTVSPHPLLTPEELAALLEDQP